MISCNWSWKCRVNVFGVSASRSAALSYFFWLHMGWGGVGLCSRSFNLHTLVMHTPWMLRYSWGGVGWGCVLPWMLRYSWGGVGWGCVHVPSTCARWWCTRHECYATQIGRWACSEISRLAHWLGCQLVWRKYCVHIYLYLYLYYIYIYIYIDIYIYIYTCTYTYMYIYTCTYTYMYIYTFL